MAVCIFFIPYNKWAQDICTCTYYTAPTWTSFCRVANGHNEQLKLNIFVLSVFFLLVWNTLSWVALFAGILYLLYYIIYLSSLYYKYIVNLIFLQLFELLFMNSFSCFRWCKVLWKCKVDPLKHWNLLSHSLIKETWKSPRFVAHQSEMNVTD